MQQFRWIVYGILLNCLATASAIADVSCVQFTPNTNLPLTSADKALNVAGQPGSGTIKTDQKGRIEVKSRIEANLKRQIETTNLVFVAEISNLHFAFQLFKNGVAIGQQQQVKVPPQAPYVKSLQTDKADQVLIDGDNDVYLIGVCGE